MSKITLTPHASGTGTLNIAAPNTNSTRTLTLPDADLNLGNVLTTSSSIPTSVLTGNISTSVLTGNIIQNAGPAFSAYANAAVSIPYSTYTKILYQVERFDTNGAYDNSTSRFQPAVAGYYQVTAGYGLARADAYYLQAYFFLNGTAYVAGGTESGQTNAYAKTQVTALIYMNGTSDYLEVYGVQGSGSTWNSTGSSLHDYFQGILVRAA